jgi:hypothetical protein
VDQDLADRIALAMRLEERTMTEILTQAITEYLSIHNSDTTD